MEGWCNLLLYQMRQGLISKLFSENSGHLNEPLEYTSSKPIQF